MVEPLGNFTKIVPIEQIEVNKCIKGHDHMLLSLRSMQNVNV